MNKKILHIKIVMLHWQQQGPVEERGRSGGTVGAVQHYE
jgi:hypothetical protein